MVPHSPFLRALAANPQSAQGTDWTLIGSDADTVVPSASALAMGAAHKVVYDAGSGLDHADLQHATTGTYTLRSWDARTGHWRTTGSGAAPVGVAGAGLFWQGRR
ncbi:hypothetical protein [Streptomyces sp. NBC_01304]|uniref:hypothetical protein n=1 Tax=Streptomyces sp. NBC_01304 TaxID=2903818 RepID=UPI002E1542D1|nr:hypothetical protein OG430_26245 [Streptomyces sp. NBC_01304]